MIDIGGWDFFLSVKRSRLTFDRWITLELDPKNMFTLPDPAFVFVRGDGSCAPFRDQCCDTILGIHVLEHVVDPLALCREMARVLKPGGYGILLAPQTAPLHGLPAHFQNFTVYWLRYMCREVGVHLIEHIPVGGFWSTIVFRMCYFFLHSSRQPGYSAPEFQRPVWFYLLWPFMATWALLNIVVCLILSLGDLTEEPNSHLLVFQKPA